MTSWGIMFVIIGILSFVLPALDKQFFLIQIFGDGNETLAGIFYIVVGAVLSFIGFTKKG